MDPDGRWAEVPESVPYTGQRAGGRFSGISAIETGSRVRVVRALNDATVHGAACLRVPLVNGAEAECHMIDVRSHHGVVVGILIGVSHLDVTRSLEDRPPPPPPRTGRMEKDTVAVVVAADDQVCRMLGYDHDELVGQRSVDLIHPDDRDTSIGLWLQLLEMPGSTVRLRSRHRRADGTWMWVEITNHHLVDGDGEPRIVAELTDVSEEVAVLEQLRQREELLTRLTEALPSGVAHVDLDRNLILTNARLHRVLGVIDADDVDEQFAHVWAPDRAMLSEGLGEVLTTGRPVDVEVRLDLPAAAGQHRISVAIRVLTDDRDQPAGAVLAVDDVTDESALRTELERRATVDELTGCLNRSAVLELLHRRLAESRRAAHGTTVCLFDLDDFKSVNDTYGHHTGDQVLTAVATRVAASLREDDVLGRLGGDEFVVIASGVRTVDEAAQIARRVEQAFSVPFALAGGVRLDLRASVGTAWSGPGDVGATQLIARADQAMYREKRSANAPSLCSAPAAAAS